MKGITGALFKTLIFPVVIVGAFWFGSIASAQTCSIAICKRANVEGPEVPLFPFIADIGGEVETFSLPPLERGGACLQINFNSSVNPEIIEEDIFGWVLDDIQCEVQGIDVTLLEDGVRLECTGPNTGDGQCSFFNVPGFPPRVDIPTLSEWAMIAAAAGLGFVGVLFTMRRRRLHTGA